MIAALLTPRLAWGSVVVLGIALGVVYVDRARVVAQAARQAQAWAMERASMERQAREAGERYRALEHEAGEALGTLARARAEEMRRNEKARGDVLGGWPAIGLRGPSSDASADAGLPKVPGPGSDDAVACEDRLRGAREALAGVVGAAGAVATDGRALAVAALDAQDLLAHFREVRGALLACERMTNGGEE